MQDGLRIVAATPAHADAIATLIADLLDEIVDDKDCPPLQPFLISLQSRALRVLLQHREFHCSLAWQDAQLAGLITLRQLGHVFHLFVAREFQRRGIARQLWLHAQREARRLGYRGAFTVNAAPRAVPAYLRLGFQPTGAEASRDGLRWQPMRSHPLEDMPIS